MNSALYHLDRQGAFSVFTDAAIVFARSVCGGSRCARVASRLALERFRNGLGYTPMKSIKARRGSSNPASRKFKSESFEFASLVFVPNTTRWSIQSIYTAAQITPVPASMVTIQACCTTVDVHEPSMIRNSPTKPFKNGRPIEESEANTNSAENHGIGRARPPKSEIMRVCRRS